MEERIDNYFNKQLTGREKEQFEKDLKADPELAESVAFYLLVKNSARQDARQDARDKKLTERHTEWQTLRAEKPHLASRSLFYFAAAAVVLIALGLGWYFLNLETRDAKQLADAYVQENFSSLGVQMDGNADSLQHAISAYNKGEYESAALFVANILKRDPGNAEAQKLAGIVSLKLRNYDKAITHFHQLGEQRDLFSNPGKFYEAIAHIQRGLPLDKKAADDLLREVIDGNLEGKDEALKWVE